SSSSTGRAGTLPDEGASTGWGDAHFAPASGATARTAAETATRRHDRDQDRARVAMGGYTLPASRGSPSGSGPRVARAGNEGAEGEFCDRVAAGHRSRDGDRLAWMSLPSPSPPWIQALCIAAALPLAACGSGVGGAGGGGGGASASSGNAGSTSSSEFTSS